MGKEFLLGMAFTYLAMFFGAVIDHFEIKRRLKVIELEKELKQND